MKIFTPGLPSFPRVARFVFSMIACYHDTINRVAASVRQVDDKMAVLIVVCIARYVPKGSATVLLGCANAATCTVYLTL